MPDGERSLGEPLQQLLRSSSTPACADATYDEKRIERSDAQEPDVFVALETNARSGV